MYSMERLLAAAAAALGVALGVTLNASVKMLPRLVAMSTYPFPFDNDDDDEKEEDEYDAKRSCPSWAELAKYIPCLNL